MIKKIKLENGFTLVEMAVVLIILGVLIGGLVIPITAQHDIKHIEKTRDHLKSIHDAIIGFALLNGRLPCPSTQTDPANLNYGVEDATCSASYAGNSYLPWKTLGVPETDDWATSRRLATDSVAGLWIYRVDRNYTTMNGFNANMVLSTPGYGDTLSIVDSNNNSLNTANERPIAIIFSVGKDRIANGNNASYEATSGIYETNEQSSNFDDILIWVSRPALFSKLVSAGKLP